MDDPSTDNTAVTRHSGIEAVNSDPLSNNMDDVPTNLSVIELDLLDKKIRRLVCKLKKVSQHVRYSIAFTCFL